MSHPNGTTRGGRAMVALVAALLFLGITKLPAGVGTHGRTGETSSNSSINYRLSADPNDSFTQVVNGLTADVAGVNMRDAINATGRFTASLVSDPEDPNAVSIEITKVGGADVDRLAVCKDVAEYSTVGVHFPSGKDHTVISKPVALAANGIYRLRINMWDTTDYDMTFDTSTAANDTPAELLANVIASLDQNGFTVTDLGTMCGEFGAGFATAGCIKVQRVGDMMKSTRVDVTDTGASRICTGLIPFSSSPGMPGEASGIPTLSQYGMFALVVLMTGAAILVLRRRRFTTS